MCVVLQDGEGPRGIDQLQCCCAREYVHTCLFESKCLKLAPACLLCTHFSSCKVSWEINKQQALKHTYDADISRYLWRRVLFPKNICLLTFFMLLWNDSYNPTILNLLYVFNYGLSDLSCRCCTCIVRIPQRVHWVLPDAACISVTLNKAVKGP